MTPRQRAHTLCTFQLAGNAYGLHVLDVREVLGTHRLTRVPGAPPAVEGLMNLRGLILTVIDLRRMLGLPEREPAAVPQGIVVNGPDGPISVLVDALGDVVDAPMERFEPSPDAELGGVHDLVRGAYKLDGSLLVELDTRRMIEAATAVRGNGDERVTGSSGERR